MCEKTRYYRFDRGNVIVRRTGDRIEKKGKSGVWEDAPNLRIRFISGDDSLIEISPDELTDEEKS